MSYIRHRAGEGPAAPWMAAAPARAEEFADLADLSGAPAPGRAVALPPAARARLVERLVVAFRHHPHINNVMTHISGARWDRVAAALDVIFDAGAPRAALSPLGENIVVLMQGERGVTGRILKPCLGRLLAALLPAPQAAQGAGRIAALHVMLEAEGAADGAGAPAATGRR